MSTLAPLHRPVVAVTGRNSARRLFWVSAPLRGAFSPSHSRYRWHNSGRILQRGAETLFCCRDRSVRFFSVNLLPLPDFRIFARMKILVLNWQDITNPLGGGAEVHLHEIFSRVAARGHDVTLYCCAHGTAPAEEILDGMRILREGSRSVFNYYVPMRYLSRFRHEQYDIVVDDINKIPFYTPLYVREPLLAVAHHFFGTSIFREAGILPGSYVYTAEKLVDYVYKKTQFAVVSQSTLDEYVERGFSPRNFSIIPNCIDQSKFPMQTGTKAGVPTVAYFGRLKKYKSVDHLVRAFALVQRQIPEARLDILGTGDFRPELERLVGELGIAGQTTFYGYVTDEQKVELMSRAWCMVNPSMKEGWGITNIEANACGTPVISANVPGLRDSVLDGKSGLLYTYGEVPELAGILSMVLNDSALRTRLSDGAVAWANQFDWNTSAELMIQRCKDVIATHGR